MEDIAIDLQKNLQRKKRGSIIKSVGLNARLKFRRRLIMKTRLTSNDWELSTPIAHRGLWNEEFPENSVPAYKNAIEHGYPIEMDIQMSVDGELFCFHDDNALRMTGVDKDIRTMTASEITALNLKGEKIPTFKEFLELVGGKVPLLIEIKQQINKGVEKKTVDALKGYKGEYAIQSFDPFIMMRIKKLAPEVIRGQLGCKTEEKGFRGHIVRNLTFNFLVKPDFVHYGFWGLPIKKSVSNGLPIMCWTVNDNEKLEIAKKYAQNYVFENIIPE